MNRKMMTILALAGVGAATAALSVGLFMHAKNSVTPVAECTP
ncbi:MAG TPA: hypothetical protein VK209_10200 [Candidatus Sulfotelmatobacter sp.]|jgi:hypothetical protein|nr:hypothetical protein [Candidatus Sulfotelmatobacter sp.]